MCTTKLPAAYQPHTKIGCLINVISALADCDCFKDSDEEKGSLVLAHGQHEITIKTAHKPEKVFLTTADAGSTPVCQGNIDMVGYTLIEDGFVLYADIHSNTAEVSWVVGY